MNTEINTSATFNGNVRNEVMEYAFQVYLLGQLDEKLFIFFCLMNKKYQA